MSVVILLPCSVEAIKAQALPYVFYTPDGTVRANIEPGDFFTGVVEGMYIEGQYNGGNLAEIESFSIASQVTLNL